MAIHPTTCAACNAPLPPHGYYIVRMEVFAEPSLPPLTDDQVESLDFDKELTGLLKQMETLSADELQDQVHRHFAFHVCHRCHAKVLANPLGLPRADDADLDRSGARRN
jgi:hypothetical protein